MEGLALDRLFVLESLRGGLLPNVIVSKVVDAIPAAWNRTAIRSHEVILTLIVAPNSIAAFVQ